MKLSKQMRLVVTLVAVWFAISACRSKTMLDESQKVVSKKSGMEMWATWVKDKGKKYDFELFIGNKSGEHRIIMLKDISCFKGDTQGRLKHTFFNTGERVIDFGKNELKRFVMVCRHGSDTPGPFKVSVEKIYRDNNGDGRTTDEPFKSKMSLVIKP